MLREINSDCHSTSFLSFKGEPEDIIIMESFDYRTFFKEWKDWAKFEKRVDGINGVYAFKLKNDFGRLIGRSSVLYIGKTDQNPEKNKRPGIWHRLMNYRQKNDGASRRLKNIEKRFGGKESIQYSYVICANPREMEKKLLENYYLLHMEFPPLNRNA